MKVIAEDDQIRWIQIHREEKNDDHAQRLLARGLATIVVAKDEEEKEEVGVEDLSLLLLLSS
jgi:hypothetical protein